MVANLSDDPTFADEASLIARVSLDFSSVVLASVGTVPPRWLRGGERDLTIWRQSTFNVALPRTSSMLQMLFRSAPHAR